MQRRSLLKSLGGLLVIPALPSLGAIAADKKSVLRVAHLTDIHLKDKWDAPARFAKCIHHVQQQPDVDFILNGGDVVFDINKENLDVINAQWSLWHKTLKAECSLPMHYVLGNHDVWWSENDKGQTLYGKKYSMDQGRVWWGNRKFYNLLALKKGTWFKGYLSSQLLKSGKWTYPKVKFKEVDPDSAALIVKYLDQNGFYALSRASLDINTKEVGGKIHHFRRSDCINYKFEILSANKLLIIESYDPEYLAEKIPEIKAKTAFIKYRDWFTLKYKALEPIEE